MRGQAVVHGLDLVVGDAEGHREPDPRRRQRRSHQPDAIVKRQPGPQHPSIRRRGKGREYPQRRRLDAPLVPVKPPQVLDEALGQSVKPVGAVGGIGVDLILQPVIADGMDGTRIDHAGHAGLPRALVDVIAADDIGLQDVVPRTLQRHAAEMHHGLNALAGFAGGLGIVQVEGQRLFVRGQVRDGRHIGQPQLAGQRRQTAAQLRAKAARGPGDQDRVKAGHLVSDTARAMRARASVRTLSAVAVEMRKNGDRP